MARRLLAVALLWAAGAGPLLAQSETTSEPDARSPEILPTIPVPDPAPAEEEAAPAEDAGARQLETVIVTATKREKSLREIPASIREFDGRNLESKGVLSINEVLETTPGVAALRQSAAAQQVRDGSPPGASLSAEAAFPLARCDRQDGGSAAGGMDAEAAGRGGRGEGAPQARACPQHRT